MFGYTIISKKRLKDLETHELQILYVWQVHRWFAGWKDLDIIWDWVFSKRDFGGISGARSEYAKARGTDEYGSPLLAFNKKDELEQPK